MKKLLFLLVLISHFSFSQELDSLSTDSVVVIPPKHLMGAYAIGGIGLNPNPTPAGLGWVQTIGVGVRFDNMEAGFTISELGSTLQRRLIFPNIFGLIYRHGGGYFSYRLVETEYLSFAPFVGFQVGDMVWERVDSGDDFLRDEMNLIQFGLKIDAPYHKWFEYARYVRPELIIGYQSMRDLNLAGLTNQDFSGFFIGFNVKVGYFNQ